MDINELTLEQIQSIHALDTDAEAAHTTTIIFTPSGSTVVAKTYIDDYEGKERQEITEMYDNLFPGLVRLSYATTRYNCHSYAWYSQDVQLNHYWISDPSVYISDNSAFSTTATVGAKVCYFDSSGTIIHSGIVQSISNGEIIVDSKWGSASLYRHKLEYCPYIHDTAYIRYYDYHNFVYTVKGEGTHYVTCTDCDFSTTALHVWGENPNPGQGYICERCYYTASSIPMPQGENTVPQIN